jgi:hypothetical protein
MPQAQRWLVGILLINPDLSRAMKAEGLSFRPCARGSRHYLRKSKQARTQHTTCEVHRAQVSPTPGEQTLLAHRQLDAGRLLRRSVSACLPLHIIQRTISESRDGRSRPPRGSELAGEHFAGSRSIRFRSPSQERVQQQCQKS